MQRSFGQFILTVDWMLDVLASNCFCVVRWMLKGHNNDQRHRITRSKCRLELASCCCCSYQDRTSSAFQLCSGSHPCQTQLQTQNEGMKDDVMMMCALYLVSGSCVPVDIFPASGLLHWPGCAQCPRPPGLAPGSVPGDRGRAEADRQRGCA